MAPLQKFFSHLLLAVFAAGALGCPCPAAAVTGHEPKASHEHHLDVHHESTAAEKEDHSQAQCQADCDRVFAEAPRNGLLPHTANPSFDPELKGPDPESIFSFGSTRSVTSIGPPSQIVRVSHETPVRRFDLLLA